MIPRLRKSRTSFWLLALTLGMLVLATTVFAQPGVIRTVAGTETSGFNGDGIPATSANLHNPRGVFVDGSGDIFIGDQTSHRVRRVDAATGLISTVAGTGTFGYNGDGIPATSARLHNPRGVSVDGAGNIFIADQTNNRIRKVDAATGLISTVAGTGAAGFNGDGIPATTAQVGAPRVFSWTAPAISSSRILTTSAYARSGPWCLPTATAFQTAATFAPARLRPQWWTATAVPTPKLTRTVMGSVTQPLPA